jgi:hypothetical protein
MADRGHQGKAYEACRAYAIAEFDTCLRCGHGVDKLLSGRHPWGPTLDLVVPWSKGGTMTPANSRLSHNRCNSAYRDGRKLRGLVAPRTRYSASRAW